MAQMMKSHQWPTKGIASNRYTPPIWGEQYSDFSSHTYNWAIMPRIPYNNLSDSTAQVAQICYDAGVSVNMEYGIGGSHPPDDKEYFFGSMSEFFNYTCNNFTYYDSTNSAGWYSVIQNEVVDRPIFYISKTHAIDYG